MLGVMRAVTDNASTLAVAELRFVIAELLARGRREDGQRMIREDLIEAGLKVEDREG